MKSKVFNHRGRMLAKRVKKNTKKSLRHLHGTDIELPQPPHGTDIEPTKTLNQQRH